MKELSLFSGAGGGLLGTKLLGWECVGYVEYNDYCQRVIRARIDDGIFDDAPIFGDIRAFLDCGYADSYKGMVDVVTAGFPCQPFSVAGKQQGEDDERNMWPQTLAVLRAVRPRFALLENVPGLLSHEYARRIFGDLAESGFDARWRVLSAAELGAPHRRKRLWIFCADALGERPKRERKIPGGTWREQQFKRLVQETLRSGVPACTRSGISDGFPRRMDRLKALGNGQVPAVVRAAWELLT